MEFSPQISECGKILACKSSTREKIRIFVCTVCDRLMEVGKAATHLQSLGKLFGKCNFFCKMTSLFVFMTSVYNSTLGGDESSGKNSYEI